jgi:hypothetical protein
MTRIADNESGHDLLDRVGRGATTKLLTEGSIAKPPGRLRAQARRRVSRGAPPTPQPKRLAHHFQASALLGSLSGLSHWLLNLQPFAHIVWAGDGTVSPGPLVRLLAIDAALE